MTEQEVISILGSPTESSSGSLLGISGTASRWVGRDAEINVRFVGGKVATKTYDSPPVTPHRGICARGALRGLFGPVPDERSIGRPLG